MNTLSWTKKFSGAFPCNMHTQYTTTYSHYCNVATGKLQIEKKYVENTRTATVRMQHPEHVFQYRESIMDICVRENINCIEVDTKKKMKYTIYSMQYDSGKKMKERKKE